MASIAECQNDIARYNKIKAQISDIIASLSAANNNGEDLANKITDLYTVNDASTPIVTRTLKLNKEIVKTINYLSGTIIPAIDQVIAELNRTIARLEQEAREREERERREREERERREREERERREREEKNEW